MADSSKKNEEGRKGGGRKGEQNNYRSNAIDLHEATIMRQLHVWSIKCAQPNSSQDWQVNW